jgi:nucleoside 2-deoxyribosyltransferase
MITVLRHSPRLLSRKQAYELSNEAREILEHINSRFDGRTSPILNMYLRNVDRAFEHGRRDEVIHALFRLRGIARRFAPTGETMFYRQRIAELEEEVNRLSAQVEESEDREPEESEDEQENAVKKFNSSKNKVFVIMPFSPEFDDVWIGGIKRACQDDSIAALRVDQVSLSSWITDDVEEFVKKSTTVISDVTGSNPNVLFELGYALAKGKDPIIICQHQDSSKIPFDIAGIRHLGYENSWRGIEQLAKELKKYLVATIDKQKGHKTGKASKKKTES